MKKLFLILVLCLVWSEYSFAKIEIFGFKTGKLESKKNLILVKEKSDSIKNNEVFGDEQIYFVENHHNISEEFHLYNIRVIKLKKDFLYALNKKYKKKEFDGELITSILAEGKNLYSYEQCEIQRKALLHNLKKKYTNDGYIADFGKLKLLDIQLETGNELFLKKKDTFEDYIFRSWCGSNDGGGYLRPDGSRRPKFNDTQDPIAKALGILEDNILSKFKKKKDNKVEYFLLLSFDDQALINLFNHLYEEYLNGKLSDFSLKGF